MSHLDDSVTSSCMPEPRGPAFHSAMHCALEDPVMMPVRSHVALRSRSVRSLLPGPAEPLWPG